MIEVYSKPLCSYCQKAKVFLKEKGIEFIEHDVSNQEDFEKIKKITGHKTVPVIVIDGKLIGGYQELIQKMGATSQK